MPSHIEATRAGACVPHRSVKPDTARPSSAIQAERPKPGPRPGFPFTRCGLFGPPDTPHLAPNFGRAKCDYRPPHRVAEKAIPPYWALA